MRYSILLLLLLGGVCSAHADCKRVEGPKKTHLHWREPTVSYGPDCSFALQVDTDPAGNVPAKAHLFEKRPGGERVLLFTIDRDANLYWDRSGARVALQDQHVYGVYRLFLFDVPSAIRSMSQHGWPNEALRRAMEKGLRPNEEIVRFWPDLGKWLPNGALITVKVETGFGREGPLMGKCRGFLVSTDESLNQGSVGG